MRRLTLTHTELPLGAPAPRGGAAAELLSPTSFEVARELLESVDAKLPDAADHHPTGPAAGRLLAGDEILRLLLHHEDRYGHAALGRDAIARELAWKPLGTSVREL